MACPSRIAKIVALFVAWISFAHAQGPSGSIAGVIRDSAGAAMTAAQVKILSTSTGPVRTMVTSATGDYSFPFLPPGEYEVSVEASGFQRTIRKASVEAGETTTTNFNLAIGDVKESVNVDGATP